MPDLVATPGQTVGPFFHYALPYPGDRELVRRGTPGSVWLHGHVYDGDGNVDQYGLGVEPSIIRIAPFVWSNGGELVDDLEQPTRFSLDSPEADEALRQFFDLRGLHIVVPTEEEVESEDDETRFLNGRSAMVSCPRGARRRPSARSPTSTGTSRPCPGTTSRPGSCTRTPTA